MTYYAIGDIIIVSKYKTAGETAKENNMLQVTIKDIKTNEVIYDEQVSMVIMQAAEKNGIRSIRHTSEDASLNDVLNCIETARKAVSDAKGSLSKAFEQAIGRTNFEKGETDE